MKKISSIHLNSFILFAVLIAIFLVSATFVTFLSDFTTSNSAEVPSMDVFKDNSSESGGQDGFEMAQTNVRHVELKSWLQEGNPSIGQVRRAIDNLISQHQVIVFAKSTCPFCLRAIGLLDSKVPSVLRRPFAVVNLDHLSRKFRLYHF
jgi:hypothetical protein